MNMKKLFLLNLPYLLFVYPFDKLAQAFRLAPGSDSVVSMRTDRARIGTTFVLSGHCLHGNFTETKIVKAERKRELVHGFPRRILSKTMSKIAKNGE